MRGRRAIMIGCVEDVRFSENVPSVPSFFRRNVVWPLWSLWSGHYSSIRRLWLGYWNINTMIGVEVNPLKSIVSLVAVIFFISFATIVLIVALGFSIERGEMELSPHQDASGVHRVHKAADISLIVFVLLETAATWIALTSKVIPTFRLHWSIRLLGLFVILIIVSYLSALLLVGSRIGVIINLTRFLSDCLSRVAG